MIKTAATVLHEGETYECPAKLAQALIDAGVAMEEHGPIVMTEDHKAPQEVDEIAAAWAYLTKFAPVS
jgi:hypothetical protein